MNCTECGAALGAQASFCTQCGTRATKPDTATRVGATPPRRLVPGTAAGPAQPDLAGRFGGLPVEIQLVVGLLAVGGGLLVISALRVLPDVLSGLFESGPGAEFVRAFAALLAIIVIYTGGIGAALLALAWLLSQGDRVGRVLTIAVAVVAAIAMLTAEGRAGGEVLAMLAAAVVAAVLAFSPNVRAYFTGPAARQHDHPEPVVAARSLLAPFLAIQGLTGLAFLPVAELDGKFALIGLVLIGVSVVGFQMSAGLARGDRQARAVVSIGMGVYVLLAFWSEVRGVGLVVPLGFAAAVMGLLWVPDTSKYHFGDLR